MFRHLPIQDHIVPLKEAWISGANAWDAEKRREFANDIFKPELLAVSRESNRAKGDKGPAEWLPLNEDFQCDYVMAWFDVKTSYELTFDAAEKEALLNVLTGPPCGDRE
ncbi:hypothetical protein Clacol_008558 [Clathrus columnatus]|uniref:GmrSD restriction endonucleases C-terminal domain-containing protein n=1 Tax=Clathrus columnatus TaxID=1419009 RepID=A0AAV5AI63_9AGAM|nr:hypothetical protein Clacol_008558 [Clathrus columnatus]